MKLRSIVRLAVLGVALTTKVVTAGAAETALWLRYPAISPDGQTIAFSSRGDLWKVPARGGLATQSTVHADYDFMPTWSSDGSKIAFASDRYGTSDVFGKAVGKEAIVLDTRFNGGGWLDEALIVFLTGEVYARNLPRGQERGVEPTYRWSKPSIVVMNEGNYSDARCFPSFYTALDIGKTVGMQVPGTCTAVWWESLQNRQLYFGIPQVGVVDNEGDLMENKHLDPDYMIDNDPALEAIGRDQQLEKAVEALLAELDG